MDRFTRKSIIYMPLMLLALGIIPIMVMPFWYIFENAPIRHAYQADGLAGFPFGYGFQFALLPLLTLVLPGLWMMYAMIMGKKTYHGIYLSFIAFGMLLKFQYLLWYMQALLAIVMVVGFVNFLAYLYMLDETTDDWLRYYFKKSIKSKSYATYGGNSQYQASPVPQGQQVVYNAMIAKFNFNRLVGMQDFKDRLLKAGQEALKTGIGDKTRNGILLGGEPGNGKTAMAQALAGQLKIPIIAVSFGDIASMWVNETTQKVMKVFDDAEIQAPCMLFIDEIDAVLVNRAKVVHADSESSKTVAAVLRRLETIRGRGVVVVAATNFMERLDPASIREGRFDFKLEVPPPDFEARKFLLTDGLKSVTDKIEMQGLERAAKRWEGYSVARIRAIATETLAMLNDNKINHVGFDELALALKHINAAGGDRIPEDALSIDQLVLEPSMKEKVKRLSSRMTNIDQIEEMGGSVPRGVLFYGPAGTGKTIAAMALAKSSGWAFLKSNGHSMLRDPDVIDDIIRRAKDIRPCIIFIDEADDVLADRQTSPYSKDVTNKLLTIMDGAGGRIPDVMFVAATNAPDIIDDAMLRGGRFSEKIGFDVPGDTALHEYVSQWIAKAKAPLAEDFDAWTVANKLKGQSLANVGEILQQAINEAIPIDGSRDFRVELRHLDEAIRVVKG